MKVTTLLGKVILVASLLIASGLASAAPVNVNTADVQTLAENINGVGPKKAQAIVTYRQSNGPFRSTQDLVKVKGIGQKIIEKNKSDLRFSDASAKTGKKKAAKN
jgi:competence protein ComEA